MILCDSCGNPVDLPEINGPVTAPADAAPWFSELRSLTHERTMVLDLDARNRPIHEARLVAVGGLRATVIQPRDILGPCLQNQTAAIIMAHNHPSGDTSPSSEDLAVTRQLVAACQLLGLEMLDHLIITDNQVASLRELGHI